VTHLGRRDHTCPHENCNSAFGYKHLLQRHLAKIHSTQTGESDSAVSTDEETEQEATPKGNGKATQRMDIDAITGMSYTSHAKQRLSTSKALRCPHPSLGLLLSASISNDGDTVSASKACDYVFSRAYDLRRHLRAEHGVEAEKESVDDWVKSAKAKAKRNKVM